MASAEDKRMYKSFVTNEMIDAYIDAYLGRAHAPDNDGRPGGRNAVARGLEAAISVQAFALKDILKQAREVFASEPMAIDVLDYIDQLIERQGA